MIIPNHDFFKKFTTNHLHPYRLSDKNTIDEFEHLVSYFGDWVKVEVIFKELEEEIKVKEKSLVRFMKYKNEYNNKHYIECFTISHIKHSFFFIKYYIENKEEFRVFVTESKQAPREFHEHFTKYLNKTLETTLSDLLS